MFYWHLQTVAGQPVAGAAGSRHFDRPQRREPTVTAGHILSGSFETKSLGISLTVSEIFNGECDAMDDG